MHDVVRAAASGNTASQLALEQAARWIGHGLANVATVLQPDVVFLGGGVAEAGDALLTPIRDNIRRLSPLVPPESYRVVLGALGAWAGAIGAALAAGRLAG
jgi:glucokinase